MQTEGKIQDMDGTSFNIAPHFHINTAPKGKGKGKGKALDPLLLLTLYHALQQHMMDKILSRFVLI